MWNSLPATQPALFFTPKQARPPISLAVAANSQPSRHRRSSPDKKQPQQRTKHKQERQNETQKRGAVANQLSGLDVLWAMQKAAAEKNRKGRRHRKAEEFESSSSRKEEETVEYSNVRPLCIKSNWGNRLDDLEKRIQRLYRTK